MLVSKSNGRSGTFASSSPLQNRLGETGGEVNPRTHKSHADRHLSLRTQDVETKLTTPMFFCLCMTVKINSDFWLCLRT